VTIPSGARHRVAIALVASSFAMSSSAPAPSRARRSAVVSSIGGTKTPVLRTAQKGPLLPPLAPLLPLVERAAGVLTAAYVPRVMLRRNKKVRGRI
jgi:hypothetical protein